MRQGITLFAQIQAFLSRPVFQSAVDACHGDRKVHQITCWSHVLYHLLAVLSGQRSLRHMEQSHGGRGTYLAQFGLNSVKRASASHANQARPWTVLTALLEDLLARCRQVAPPHPLAFSGRLLSIDATVIHVCHTLQKWALWAEGRAGVKLHIALDHGGNWPAIIDITSARVYDRTAAKRWSFPPDTVICFDRGYFDCGWFAELARHKVTFVTLRSYDARYVVVHARPVAANGPVRADETIRFAGKTSAHKFKGMLRLITYRKPNGTVLQVLTNQMDWDAERVADIYHARWRIELFFKWLKHQLPVLHFYGNDENAVRWQLLVALCAYLLLSWLAFLHRWTGSLTPLLRRVTAYLFDRVALVDLLAGSYQFQP
ncbi:MAG: IS4 family transposase [Chloroflexi bacterium]|nr:MAG: IS4 family transposase [Chloroflexota bacterium]RPJ49666.1 MAG: IS4 family transposase [Euryarchaeota archaeon]